jgi:hypothetical protein
MISLVSLLLLATPVQCNKLWPEVWKSYAATELTGELPALFKKLPDAKERLGAAWVLECRQFDAKTTDCARGVTLEKELATLRNQLKKEKASPKEIELMLGKMRSQWRILDCRQVNQALDVSAAKVAKEANL